eukprot:scaffold11728_cov32-Tisochrysis_lutea.AAC.4
MPLAVLWGHLKVHGGPRHRVLPNPTPCVCGPRSAPLAPPPPRFAICCGGSMCLAPAPPKRGVPRAVAPIGFSTPRRLILCPSHY